MEPSALDINKGPTSNATVASHLCNLSYLHQCLYSFFCYVAWVTFSRKDLRGIQEEVGRLLRSDTFNPALRTRIDATEDNLAQDSSTKEGQTEPKVHTQSHNAPEQRCVGSGGRLGWCTRGYLISSHFESFFKMFFRTIVSTSLSD